MIAFTAVIALGAFLLILVQPLVARQILPWFGGAQSVWSVCLLFYQSLLLVGYLYAHLGRRLGARRQAWLHAALLVTSLALLPITASERWKPTPDVAPTWWLLGLLATTVGGPYLLLSATAPLLQTWFTRARPGRSPYPLYALSNAGSLVALLAYPVAVEPLLGVSRQSVWWSWAYAAFALACGALALWVARVTPPDRPPNDPPGEGSHTSRAQIALWLSLSACGSGLLLALTNHITMDVAPVPFLWVLPLAAYLITFVLAFAGLYRRATWGALLVLAIAAMALFWDVGFAFPLSVQVGVALGVLFSGCMVCHGELARSAPPPARLTTFYLTLAAGGALGGVLVALVAPAVLRDLWELPAFLLLAYGLLLVVMEREARIRSAGPFWPRASWAVLGLVLVVGAAAFAMGGSQLRRGTVSVSRNFYGVLRVQDIPEGLFTGQRVLRVGRIFHGGQFLDAARAGEATAYYSAGSGVEMAIRRHPLRRAGAPLSIGVIGLGVGTLAAWGEPGDSIRFYEINPDVEEAARRWFSFLGRSAAAVTVVPGDGRLSLEREVEDPSRRPSFDVLVADAFAGDAVPVHLLTREAAEVYGRALAADGVLAFHVTNRHLDLEPVVRGLAGVVGAEPVRIRSEPHPGSGGTPSTWVLLTRNPALAAELRRASPEGSSRTVLWTDDHSDLLRLLR
jgi:hypothetical protein